MPALPAVFLFSVSNSVCYSSMYHSLGRTSTALYYPHSRVVAPCHLFHAKYRYRTPDVTENFGKYLSGMQRTSQGKDFEVILRVKMETRHPV